MHTSNQKHREWEEAVRQIGCIVTSNPYCEIHHVKGRSFKHNKTLIGPWYVLPLFYEIHRGPYPNAYHLNKHGFIQEFGHPKVLFSKVLEKIDHNLDSAIIDAIMDCGV